MKLTGKTISKVEPSGKSGLTLYFTDGTAVEFMADTSEETWTDDSMPVLSVSELEIKVVSKSISLSNLE